MFEIKWTAGDVTWLPYDRTSELEAINTYFDILGIGKISELSKGDDKVPGDNPQVFLGAVPIATHYISSIKIKRSFSIFLSSISSFLCSCFPCSSTLHNFDDAITLTLLDMDTPTTNSETSPNHGSPIHPLIELTTKGEYLVKTPPGDKNSKSPCGKIFTKNMITNYIAYSNLCNENSLDGPTDITQKLQSHASAGYNTFAKFYNDHSTSLGGEFVIYSTSFRHFHAVGIPVSLADFGISIIPILSTESVSGTSTDDK